MADRPYSRRHFLLSIGVASAGVALTGCPPDRPADPTEDPTVEQPPPVGDPLDAPRADIVAAECPGYDQLTENELQTRAGLDYTDVTPNPGEYCNNCMFLAEAPEYSPCIGCQLFAGPVAPEGWCSAWAAMA